MASVIGKKPCAKCDKGNGVTTCDGCQQSFCIKHIIEHRQDLALQLDNIGQEHDILRRDLTEENLISHLSRRIDEWEQESIQMIKVTANVARTDLQQCFDQVKANIIVTADKIVNEVQTCRDLDNYTENDLTRWYNELNELRTLMKRELGLEIIEDHNILVPPRMIQVCRSVNLPARPAETLYTTETSVIFEDNASIVHERFQNYVGKIILSSDGLLATCVGAYWEGSNVCGTVSYSSGIHRIRFLIENTGCHNIFFGIDTVAHELTIQALTSSYIYGWWESDVSLEYINGHRIHTDQIMKTGDQITMILNCNERQIYLEHHRIHMMQQLAVDLEKCPFPWRLLITLRSPGDSVRILT